MLRKHSNVLPYRWPKGIGSTGVPSVAGNRRRPGKGSGSKHPVAGSGSLQERGLMAAEIQISQPPSRIQTLTIPRVSSPMPSLRVADRCYRGLYCGEDCGHFRTTGHPPIRVRLSYRDRFGTRKRRCTRFFPRFGARCTFSLRADSGTAFGLAAAVFLAKALWATPYSRYSKWSSCSFTRYGGNFLRKRITCSAI